MKCFAILTGAREGGVSTCMPKLPARGAKRGSQGNPARPWTPGGKPSVNPTPCSGSLTKCPARPACRYSNRRRQCAEPAENRRARSQRPARILGIPLIVRAVPRGTANGIGSGQTSCQPGQVVEGCSWRASGRPAPQGPVHARNPGDTGLFTPGSPPFMHPAKLLRISYLSELLTERTGGEANAEVGPPAARTSSVPRGTD
jgi:hypothetical protein